MYTATNVSTVAARAIKAAYNAVEHKRRIESYTINIRRA
jgi:hypothetical protein